MIDYLDLIVVGLVCGFIGYRISDHLHQSVIADIFERLGITPDKLEKMMQDLQEEMDGTDQDPEFPNLDILIEKHGDRMFAYRKDTGLFLAQGATRDELIAMITEKVSNVTLVIAEADGAGLIKENPTT